MSPFFGITTALRAAGRAALRTGLLTGLFTGLLLSASAPAWAADPQAANALPADPPPHGELVLLNWYQGVEANTLRALVAAFRLRYPAVTVREVPVGWQNDARPAIRKALRSGEPVDLMVNVWPGLRAEFAAANRLRPIDHLWSGPVADALDESWRTLGSLGATTYGLTWAWGARSGMWYRTDVLRRAGVTPPATLADMIASFAPLRRRGITPFAVPARVWAHMDVFEVFFVRQHGIEAVRRLVEHRMRWDGREVRETLRALRDFIRAGCCDPVPVMLAAGWEDASDAVLRDGRTAWFVMGNWVNTRASTTYRLRPGVDYAIAPFPAFGRGHDRTALINSNEFLALRSGQNPDAADAFLAFVTSAPAAAIIAQAGLTPASSATDPALLDPVSRQSMQALHNMALAFKPGDQLPSTLTDEINLQLQRFLQDMSDDNLDWVLRAIEAKAQTVYAVE